MNIVQFKDGTYGIRKHVFLSGYMYLDMKSESFMWWSNDSKWFHDCKANKERVLQKWENYSDAGKIISYETLKFWKD